jgi:CRP/FNR family cyclic AMP-dependent transcriptional regulator
VSNARCYFADRGPAICPSAWTPRSNCYLNALKSDKLCWVAVPPGASPLCHVLREDPELADWIPAGRRQAAIEECVAPDMWIAPGRWPSSIWKSGIALLVLDGVIIRRIGIQGRFGAELIGAGDVLRPWQREPESTTPLIVNSDWSVVEPVHVVSLDEDFMPCMAHYPELAAGLVARAVQRSRNAVVNIAIIHQARVDVRLHMLLWHLASRWGRVRSDGTVLPLRLTHSLLADLVAARRPTVTSALSDLARRGLVRFSQDVWILSGGPPIELGDRVA